MKSPIFPMHYENANGAVQATECTKTRILHPKIKKHPLPIPHTPAPQFERLLALDLAPKGPKAKSWIRP